MPAISPDKYIFRRLRPGEEGDLTDIQNRSFADTWGFNANTLEEIAYRVNSSISGHENIIMAYLKDRPVVYCWTSLQNAGASDDGNR